MNSNNEKKKQQQKQQHAKEEEEEGKPIKNQASQIIRSRKIATDSWLERIDGCCIPDVKWQCVPNRRPKRENVQSPLVPPLQGGSDGRRVPTPQWRDREGEYSCRRSERQTEVGELTALKQGHANSGNSSVGEQPVGLSEYRCDVYSYRGARTTSWAAIFGHWSVQL